MSQLQTYTFNFPNGLHGDPLLEIFNKKTGRFFLFDLGFLGNTTAKTINKTDAIFISHTHMDHFCGFDDFIRARINNRSTMTFFGPEGIAEQIQHKLLGYTWNLIDDDQLPCKIYEIAGSRIIRQASFSRKNNFAITFKNEDMERFEVANDTYVQYIALEHRNIPSIAYKITFPDRINLKKDKLAIMGLDEGPWISSLISKYRENKLTDTISVDSQSFSVADLANKLLSIRPESVCYATDLEFNKINLDRITKQFNSCEVFFCESNFAAADKNRAQEKAHLTTTQASILSALLEAKEMHAFHFSNIYGDKNLIPQELVEMYKQVAELNDSELKSLIAEQLQS